ncbi:hypothetical protein HY627_00350 [Candidatus Uhrbacteria bacterium]|nr:hypothetical protein [Candidatus Uhrbacteria bacterium]
MKTNNGITIIEVVVYMGLLGLIMTSSILIMVQVVEGSERLEKLVRRQDEAMFVLEKIGAELALGASITSPAPGSTSSSLTLSSSSGSLIRVGLSESMLALTRGAHAPQKLHASDVRVSSFTAENHGATSSIRMLINGTEYEKNF